MVAGLDRRGPRANHPAGEVMKGFWGQVLLFSVARSCLLVCVLVSVAATTPGDAKTPQIAVPPVIRTELSKAVAILLRAGLWLGQIQIDRIQLDSTGKVPPLQVVEQYPP